MSDHSKARCLVAVFSYGSVTPAVQGACSFRIWMKSKPRILLQSKRKLYRPVELSYKQLSILILGENIENCFVYRLCGQANRTL